MYFVRANHIRLLVAAFFVCSASAWAAERGAKGASIVVSGETTIRDQGGVEAFNKIKALTGEWQAPLDDGGRMVNIFTPFAYGTKVFAEEWENGKYITSTVFYMVGSELRADHFCDFKNEPRYTVQESATDPNVLHFTMRDATNLSTHPVHFHSTIWRIVDKDHLTQDWYIEGDKKAVPPDRMEFTRVKLSLRPDGSPIPPGAGGGN